MVSEAPAGPLRIPPSILQENYILYVPHIIAYVNEFQAIRDGGGRREEGGGRREEGGGRREEGGGRREEGGGRREKE